MAEGNGNGGFTVKEIVAEIRDDVKALAAKVDKIDREGSIGTREVLTDHEGRIRAIEKQDSLDMGGRTARKDVQARRLGYVAIVVALLGSLWWIPSAIGH